MKLLLFKLDASVPELKEAGVMFAELAAFRAEAEPSDHSFDGLCSTCAWVRERHEEARQRAADLGSGI